MRCKLVASRPISRPSCLVKLSDIYLVSKMARLNMFALPPLGSWPITVKYGQDVALRHWIFSRSVILILRESLSPPSESASRNKNPWSMPSQGSHFEVQNKRGEFSDGKRGASKFSCPLPLTSCHDFLTTMTLLPRHVPVVVPSDLCWYYLPQRQEELYLSSAHFSIAIEAM